MASMHVGGVWQEEGSERAAGGQCTCSWLRVLLVMASESLALGTAGGPTGAGAGA